MIRRLVYRARQFLLALFAAPDEAERAWVQRVLAPPLSALFLRMTPDEQAHAIRVYRRLRDEGHTSEALLQAALLHDVGKAACPPLRPWERVLIVVCKALWPDAVFLWGQAAPKGWRRPFAVAVQHPLWGAQAAQKAGAAPEVVTLIRRHQENLPDLPKTPLESLLILLQAADDAS
ncbi:MAG: HD domain-containing protein [Anaerolineales bacterium]